MRLTPLVIGLLITISFSSCKGEPKRPYSRESRHSYYEFYNSLIPKDSIRAFYLADKPAFGYFLHADFFANKDWLNDSLFSPADTLYMHQQMDAAKGFVWQQDSIVGASIIPEKTLNKIFSSGIDEGWKIFYKRFHGGDGFDTFSIPLFSLDSNKCLVYQSNSCGGLCGTGYVDVYVKRSGKWVRIIHAMQWIS